MHFQIHHDSEGRWQWTLYAGGDDGEAETVLARSPEAGFISEHAVQDAIANVKRGAPSAYVEF